MKDFGCVSIITPAYNCANFIDDTIKSIQSQTYSNWELLITDDCSTDNTYDIILKYLNTDSRIKLFRFNKNLGSGEARNNSIKEATGRFIAFCDSDDRWYPNKLEEQLAFMTQNNVALSYTSYDICNEDNLFIGYVKCLPKLSRFKILRDNGIGCLTAIYDISKVGKKFMPTIRKRQDWCLWINIINEIGEAKGLQKTLATYRVRSGSISAI